MPIGSVTDITITDMYNFPTMLIIRTYAFPLIKGLGRLKSRHFTYLPPKFPYQGALKGDA